MSGTVVVSGVPGVGASRVCEGARRNLGEGVALVNFGDLMLEEALEHGLADSREGLSGVPTHDRRMLQRRAGEYVARRAPEESLLVNTHLVVRTADGFVPGLPPGVLSDVSPSALVVVDASPETILRRRGTSERTFPDEARPTVAFHRQLQNAAALSCAGATDAPIRHLPNEGEIDEAAERLASIAEGVIGSGNGRGSG